MTMYILSMCFSFHFGFTASSPGLSLLCPSADPSLVPCTLVTWLSGFRISFRILLILVWPCSDTRTLKTYGLGSLFHKNGITVFIFSLSLIFFIKDSPWKICILSFI